VELSVILVVCYTAHLLITVCRPTCFCLLFTCMLISADINLNHCVIADAVIMKTKVPLSRGQIILQNSLNINANDCQQYTGCHLCHSDRIQRLQKKMLNHAVTGSEAYNVNENPPDGECESETSVLGERQEHLDTQDLSDISIYYLGNCPHDAQSTWFSQETRPATCNTS